MAESILEKIMKSVHRLEMAALECSNKTLLSKPEVREGLQSIGATWLGEEDIDNFCRNFFEKCELDKNWRAIYGGDMDDTVNKARVTVVQKLIDYKILFDEEIEKLLEKQSIIESTISASLKNLDHSPNIKKEPIMHI